MPPTATRVLLAAALLTACGSRTALDGLQSPARRKMAGLARISDAHGVDDTFVRGAPDVTPPRDVEAERLVDAPHDTDAPTPPPDSGVACTDGGFPVAYVLDQDGAFYTFDPASLATSLIGSPACGDTAGAWDFTVSREGNAYVIYNDWRIFEVDLQTLACTPTSYVNGQLGLASDFTASVVPTAQGEQLVFYGGDQAGTPVLARSDLTSFVLSEVGPVVPQPPPEAVLADIKADALGRLFGLSEQGVFLEIDPATADLVRADTTAFTAGSWALLAFERRLYFFGDSTVWRFDLVTQGLTELGTVSPVVVGASAVPCLHLR